MRYGRFFLGVLLALVIVGVVAGVAWSAYNVGVTQGFVASGNLVPPPAGGSVNPPVPFNPTYGFYAPFGFHRPFGFGFGFLWCLFPFLFFFLIFALFRFVFWGPRWKRGGPWMYGQGKWDTAEGDIPPGVREWHRKLHEQDAVPPPPAAEPTR